MQCLGRLLSGASQTVSTQCHGNTQTASTQYHGNTQTASTQCHGNTQTASTQCHGNTDSIHSMPWKHRQHPLNAMETLRCITDSHHSMPWKHTDSIHSMPWKHSTGQVWSLDVTVWSDVVPRCHCLVRCAELPRDVCKPTTPLSASVFRCSDSLSSVFRCSDSLSSVFRCSYRISSVFRCSDSLSSRLCLAIGSHLCLALLYLGETGCVCV